MMELNPVYVPDQLKIPTLLVSEGNGYSYEVEVFKWWWFEAAPWASPQPAVPDNPKIEILRQITWKFYVGSALPPSPNSA